MCVCKYDVQEMDWIGKVLINRMGKCKRYICAGALEPTVREHAGLKTLAFWLVISVESVHKAMFWGLLMWREPHLR
jgi:hypothetical protein